MKNTKKYIALFFAASLCISMCACGKTDESSSASASSEASVSSSEASEDTPTTGMPNPMIEVGSVDEIESQTGIKLESKYIPSDAEMFVINDTLVEIQSSVENADGDEVKTYLRASKTTTEDISGVYDDNMTSSEEELSNVKVTHRYSESLKTDIYDFEKDGVKFCYIIEGEISQMTFGELFDSVLLTCGFELN